MSKSIDNRVVQMTFENRDFEKGAQESLSTLEKLKNSLSHLGDGKAFNLGKLDTSGMTVLGDSVDAVGGKFSFLEEIATGALRRIGEMAVDAGVQVANAMMFNAIGEGWDKYARETEAVQTLMAATRNDVGEGKRWADEKEQMAAVEEQLEKLMWFTDETSYKYVEMVSNIAKFTSNGFGLEEAVTAMIGVAGASSIAGVSTEKAASAMDVFSKSAATGYMQLKDWRQLEQMNFTTSEFKNLLIETGLELGKIHEIFTDDRGVKHFDSSLNTILTKNNQEGFTANSIANSMTKGRWIDDEVIAVVTKKYAEFAETLYDVMEAGGHWNNTVNLLSDIDSIKAGQKAWSDFFTEEQLGSEEFRKQLEFLIDTQSELSRTAFEKGQEAKTFAEAWEYATDAASSAWKTVFKNIFGNYTEAKELFTSLSDVFWNLFVAPSDAIASVSSEWYALGGRTELLDAIANLWKYAGSITDAIGAGFRTFFPAKSVEENAKGLYNLTVRFKEWTEGLKESEGLIKVVTGISKVFFGTLKAVFTVIGGGIKIITGFATKLVSLVKNSESANKFFTSLGSTFTKLSVVLSRSGEKFEEFKKKFKGTEAYEKLSDALEKIWGVLSKFAGSVLDKASEKLRIFGNWIVNLDFGKVADTVAKFAEPIIDHLGKVADNFVKFKDAVSDVVKNAGLDDFGSKTSAAFSKLLEAGPSVDGFIELIVAFRDDVKEALEGVWNEVQNGDYSPEKIWKALKDGFDKGLENIGNFGSKLKAALLGEDMKEDKNKSFTPFGSMMESPEGNKGMLLSVIDAFRNTEEEANKFVINFDTIMGLLWKGMGVLSLGLVAKSLIDLGRALSGLSKIPGRIATVLKDIHGVLKAFSTSLYADALLKASIAIGILAASLVALSFVPGQKLAKAAGFMFILAAAVAFVCEMLKRVLEARVDESASTYDLAMADLAKAAKRMSKLAGIGVLAAGVGLGILLIVTAVSKAAKLIKDSPVFAVFGTGMVVSIAIGIGMFIERIATTVGAVDSSIVKTILGLSAALLLMTVPIGIFGRMNLTTLLQGGAAVAVLLGAFIVFAQHMDEKQLGGIAKGLLALSGAILIISVSFKLLEGVSWQTMLVAAGSISALIAVMTLCAQFLKDKSAMVGLGVLAGSFVVLAYGASILAPALTELSAIPWESLLKLGAVAAGLTLLGAIAGLGGGVVALGIIAIAGAMFILAAAAAIGGEGALKFSQAAQLLSEVIVPLAENFLTACDRISEGAGRIGEAAYNLITSIALGIGRAAPVVAQTVTTLMANVLLGILQGLVEIVTVVIPAITQCLNQITVGLYQNWEPLKTAVWNFIQSLGFVVKDALLSMVEKIPGANLLFGDWISETKESINRDWAAMAEGIDIGTDLTSGLTTGLHGGSSGTWAAAEEVGSTTVAKLGEKEAEAESAGGGLMDKFTGGMLDKLGDVEGITSMVGETGVTNLEGFGDMFSGAGGGVMDMFGGGMLDKLGGISDITSMVGETSITNLEGFGDMFGESGSGLMGQFTEGFGSGEMDFQGITSMIGENGVTNLEGFGDMFNGAGDGLMSQFTEGFGSGGMDFEGMTSMIGENGLMNLEGFGDMFNGAGGGLMDQFTTGFGEGEGDFMSMIDDLGLEGVSELSSFAPQFEEASAENIEGVTQAIADEAPKAKEEVHDLANMSVEELMLMAKEYYDAGDTNAGDYIKGIVTQKMKAQVESMSMAVDAAVAAREKRGEFESSGEYCGSGFGGGIRNSIGSAVSAAGEMARSALSTIKSVLGVASPSKEFMYIGEFGGEGFAIGLVNMIGAVRSSAQRVADESLIAMQETMNNLATGLDENLDMFPVIRPVLDLSDVQNGSASLNNMLGMQSLHASANGLGSYSAYDKEARLASMLNQQESTPPTTMNFTIYGAEGQDVREIAEAVKDIINHELERGKVGVLA